MGLLDVLTDDQVNVLCETIQLPGGHKIKLKNALENRKSRKSKAADDEKGGIRQAANDENRGLEGVVTKVDVKVREIQDQDVTIGEFLGKGAFGAVHKVPFKNSNNKNTNKK